MNGRRSAGRVKVTGDGKGWHLTPGRCCSPSWPTGRPDGRVVEGDGPHPTTPLAHDPSVVLAQLAVMLADGGDCLCDIAVLRQQPELFGRVGSGPTVWRVLDSIHSLGLRNIAAARAEAPAPAWTAGAHPTTS